MPASRAPKCPKLGGFRTTWPGHGQWPWPERGQATAHKRRRRSSWAQRARSPSIRCRRSTREPRSKACRCWDRVPWTAPRCPSPNLRPRLGVRRSQRQPSAKSEGAWRDLPIAPARWTLHGVELWQRQLCGEARPSSVDWGWCGRVFAHIERARRFAPFSLGGPYKARAERSFDSSSGRASRR
jgi:hypothetical protein